MRLNSLSGSRSTSSANMQNTMRLTKWATFSGSWPRSRRPCARLTNSCATSLVSASRVLPGLSCSTVVSENAHLADFRADQVRKFELVWPGPCWSSWCASRSAPCRRRSGAAGSPGLARGSTGRGLVQVLAGALYSQAKQPLFHTSAQPSPPPVLRRPSRRRTTGPWGRVGGRLPPSTLHRSSREMRLRAARCAGLCRSQPRDEILWRHQEPPLFAPERIAGRDLG